MVSDPNTFKSFPVAMQGNVVRFNCVTIAEKKSTQILQLFLLIVCSKIQENLVFLGLKQPCTAFLLMI